MGNWSSAAGGTSGNMGDVEEWVQEQISENACVCFSKSYCPFASMAKETLQSVNARFVVHELDTMDNGRQIQQTLARLTGRRTVPNVFVGGQSIGGGQETEALQRSGRLTTLLEEAGAL